MRLPTLSSEKFNRPGKHPLCKLCGLPDADTIVTIKWNWFRGDDLVGKVHRKCLQETPDVTNRLVEILAPPER